MYIYTILGNIYMHTSVIYIIQHVIYIIIIMIIITTIIITYYYY